MQNNNWPEIFKTGKIRYYNKKIVIDETLQALTLADDDKNKTPKNFSTGLFEISKFLGCAPTRKNLLKMKKNN